MLISHEGNKTSSGMPAFGPTPFDAYPACILEGMQVFSAELQLSRGSNFASVVVSVDDSEFGTLPGSNVLVTVPGNFTNIAAVLDIHGNPVPVAPVSPSCAADDPVPSRALAAPAVLLCRSRHGCGIQYPRRRVGRNRKLVQRERHPLG